nr:uncharacterized protein LOC118051473 [Populus alba]
MNVATICCTCNGNIPNNHPLCHSCGATVLLLHQHMLASYSSSKLTFLRASVAKFTGIHKCPAIDALKFTVSKAANSHWIRQDKLILHVILASTSTTITPLFAAYKTSHEAWTALTRLYAGKSRTRVMQLKENLTLSNRGSCTVTEFLHGIKVIADELAIIDHPVSDDDLTLYILYGLGIEFREIAAPIHARETSLKFEVIHDLLISHESYLRRLEHQFTTSFVPTVNYSNRWSP